MHVGPEVFMNSTPLHSTPDHASHVDDEDDEEVPETPPVEQASGSTSFPIRPQQGKKASKEKVILPRMIMQSIWKNLPDKVN